MSDYISRQAAIDAINGATNDSIAEQQAIDILCDLALLPAADVVEVVRCNECIHNVGIRDNTEFYDKDIVCDYWESDGLYSTDFCSYGKRADE